MSMRHREPLLQCGQSWAMVHSWKCDVAYSTDHPQRRQACAPLQRPRFEKARTSPYHSPHGHHSPFTPLRSTYGSRSHAGARAIRGDARLRADSAVRARALQEPAARRARLRDSGRPRRGDASGRGARGGAGSVEGEQRHRRRPPVARRRDRVERLSRHRRHDVRCPSSDAHAHHAGSRAACSGDRGARRAVRPRPAGRARRRLRDGDAGRARLGFPDGTRPGLARARHHRPVRRRSGGGTPARLRCRHHGAGLRARGQPGRGHVCCVGHADGQVPPVPRRAFGTDGGAARAAAVRRHPRVSHRQGRRALQHLFERRKTRRRHRRPRQALGAGADRAAAVALRLRHPGHGYRDVRSRRKAPFGPRPGEEGARLPAQDHLRHARDLPPLQGQVRGAALDPLRRAR